MGEGQPIVLYSGGIGSWAAADRLIERGLRPTLLFTDTLIEDEDLYRFLRETIDDFGEAASFVRLADGRTPWQLFRDEGFIGNTRADLCSRVLKRDLSRAWIDAQGDSLVVAVGMDWTEINRYERAVPHWDPHRLIAPLCDPPYLSKSQMIAAVRERGIDPPRLYRMGFPHNNCGGFCVKQGHGGFRLLLRKMPERYLEHEREEERFRRETGKDVAILRDRRGGVTKPLTLSQLRAREDDSDIDQSTIGGCGCMADFD